MLPELSPRKKVDGISLQGGGVGIPLQSTATPQSAGTLVQGSAPALQVTADPTNYNIVQPSSTQLGATTDPYGTGTGGGTVDPEAAQRQALLDQIMAKKSAIEEAYKSLYGELDNLLQSRTGELNSQYGEQLKKASDQFADVLPTIDASYASLGSYDSTQRGDSREDANKGYKDTVDTIGKNKEKDMSTLGQFGKESRAKFAADKEAALRYIDSSKDTTDVGALREAKNNLDTNLSQTNVTKATLGTDASAAKDLKGRTSDNGRFQAALDSLDSVIKSSMPNSVKQAAVEAVTTAGGLSDEEKKKVQAQYGNIYAEQQAL